MQTVSVQKWLKNPIECALAVPRQTASELSSRDTKSGNVQTAPSFYASVSRRGPGLSLQRNSPTGWISGLQPHYPQCNLLCSLTAAHGVVGRWAVLRSAPMAQQKNRHSRPALHPDSLNLSSANGNGNRDTDRYPSSLPSHEDCQGSVGGRGRSHFKLLSSSFPLIRFPPLLPFISP